MFVPAIKNWEFKDLGPNSVDPDEVVHDEPPLLALQCLDANLTVFFFGALTQFMFWHSRCCHGHLAVVNNRTFKHRYIIRRAYLSDFDFSVNILGGAGIIHSKIWKCIHTINTVDGHER